MIDKILGGLLRLKLMKLFIFNPVENFDVKAIAKKVEAQRILKQNGYESVLNLSGGYKLWKDCNLEQQKFNLINQ